MFEKSEFGETAPISVQSIPAKKTAVPKPTEVAQARVTGTQGNTVAPKSRPEDVSVIGSQVVFKGELMAGEDIVIRGTIEGMIAHHSKNVIVGKEGRVRALIHATSVRIEGQVDGDIHGDDFVELLDGAKVVGNIYCPEIRIEKGARFNGTINMV